MNQEIIPIGCDCHPAYSLQSLKLRKYSLPFDWLNSEPINGLIYVNKNIKENFKYFLSNPKKNKNGYIIFEKFPYTEFMHEKDLIDDPFILDKFQRRINRFNNIRSKECGFLYNIPSYSLSNKKSMIKFYQSIIEFKEIMKEGQNLYIYIRYDESLNENKSICEMLINKITNLNHVFISQYIRYKKKNGIWGDEKEYYKLYNDLGLNKFCR